MEKEAICYLQICLVRNAKVSSLERRKMMHIRTQILIKKGSVLERMKGRK